MLEPWERALRSCVQQVPDESDVDYEAGAMPLKPLEGLLVALTPEQVAALGWFALADVAVWPQVSGVQGPTIADALEHQQLVDLGPPGKPGEHATAGRKATEALLPFVISAEKYLLDPKAPPPAASILQQVVTEVAQLGNNPDMYWREWFFRVVPAAAKIAPPEARKFAIAAFRCTLNSVPPKWDYEGGLREDPMDDSNFPGVISVVTPHRGGKHLYPIGEFSNYEPQARTIQTELSPMVAIDPYRMGYLFQTVLNAYLFMDSYSGRYDDVVCTNLQTGERWSYHAP